MASISFFRFAFAFRRARFSARFALYAFTICSPSQRFVENAPWAMDEKELPEAPEGASQSFAPILARWLVRLYQGSIAKGNAR